MNPPAWWPPGVTTKGMCTAPCWYCTHLLSALHFHYTLTRLGETGVAVDGEHATLEAYTDGGHPR